VKFVPRILPLVGVAIGGVLAINALAGARDLPSLFSNAKAFAEEAAKGGKTAKGKADKAKDGKDAKAGDPAAATGDAANAAAVVPPLPPPSIKPQPVCAPTAAELAKEAGLSPAELQVLQNLGARRGELDQQQTDLETQMALLAAAEAKLDAKAKALTGLKADVQGLLAQADGREAAEVDRLVKVFESMKPKDAAPRMVLLDDAVRIPIAAKMKERSLSAILAQMPPTDAKKLTESLAKRFAAAQTLAQNGIAQADAKAPEPAAAQPAKAKAAPVRHAKARPRKRAPASKQASAGKPDAPAAASAPAAPAAPAAAAPAKAGG
jgi:flagellar motility protein MotE (MotC chaperone)